MSVVIKNPNVDELVVKGWEDNLTLDEMKQILWENGFMVNPFAILKTWTTLDDHRPL